MHVSADYPRIITNRTYNGSTINNVLQLLDFYVAIIVKLEKQLGRSLSIAIAKSKETSCLGFQNDKHRKLVHHWCKVDILCLWPRSLHKFA